jgi:hypothetical protein
MGFSPLRADHNLAFVPIVPARNALFVSIDNMSFLGNAFKVLHPLRLDQGDGCQHAAWGQGDIRA